ncbi:MAG: hypothetical protein U9Q77_07470 [Candidatus Marinimicrobia bacterium]|nr:hypothetical protein [Candidatus Neomarinimicrobiota bacterium]
MRIRIINYSFMILLLAAHFSRANNNLFAGLVLFVPFLLLIRRGWVVPLLQGVGYLAALSWLFSAYQYIQLRIAEGDDWIRLAVIIFTIAVYSAWSSYYLNPKSGKDTNDINQVSA